MSDDNDSTSLEFSAFDLMPEWAQQKTEPRTKPKPRPKKGESGGKGRRGGQREERRGGFRGGGGYRGGGGGGGGFRGKDGGGKKPHFRDRGRGRGRDHRGKGGRSRKHADFRIPGLQAKFEPSPAAVEALTRHIRDTVRAYPVADLAKMIVGSQDRYQIRFRSEKGGPSLFQCRADGSLWLSRDEVISHFLHSHCVKKYYVAEEVALDPPKGNFSTVAVCGFSGTILGPPNHHEYQNAVTRIHREKFSNMSLERYKSRIQMETGEEILEKWKDKVSKTYHYRLLSEQTVKQEISEAVENQSGQDTAPPDDTTGESEEPGALPLEDSESEPQDPSQAESEPELPDDSTIEAEVSGDSEEPVGQGEPSDDEASEAVESAPSDPAEEKKSNGVLLKTNEELERHFRQNFADLEVEERREAVVAGTISWSNLSLDLRSLIKTETNKLRRGFPFEMFQALCGNLEKEGLRFFKRGKKALHVSVVRPRAVESGLALTDRIEKVLALIQEKPKIQVVEVLEKLCEGFSRPDPKDKKAQLDLTGEAKEILADIRWLSTEGYVLEYPDTSLEIGKKGPPTSAVSPRRRKRSTRKSTKSQKPPKKAPAPSSPFLLTDDPLVAFDAADQDTDDPNQLPASVNPVDVAE